MYLTKIKKHLPFKLDGGCIIVEKQQQCGKNSVFVTDDCKDGG